MDTRKRSWIKSITWRFVGILILGVVTYAFTKNLSQTTGITVIFHGVRFILYYLHERVWERVEWGRIRHPLAHFSVREDLKPEDHAVIKQFLEEQDYVVQSPEYEI